VFNLSIGGGLGGSPSKLLGWGLGLWEKILVVTKRRPRRLVEKPVISWQQEDEEILIIIKQFLFLEGK